MSVCVCIPVYGVQKREGVGSAEDGILASCELLMWVLRPDLSPLYEQRAVNEAPMDWYSKPSPVPHPLTNRLRLNRG